ncbi:armadillo/beta-catenin/plakoglobin [Mycena floridula]|nr:armadillo/beta-catenin/plakoglobin [Mycena floridula]
MLSIQTQKNTVLVSHGRPPWYGEDGIRIYDAFVVGIAGGSASGKTHVARQIVKSLGSIPSIIILSQDSFYKRHSPEEIALAFNSQFDFDHPDALDMDLFSSCLQDLKKCKQSNIPVYSFGQHQRLDETQYLYGAAIILTEGIMALHDQKLRDLYDLKVFVQCDSDLMLARRIERDVKERGRDVQGILDQYLRYVKPAYDNFVRPTAKYADIIVPGSNNSVAIELITTHIRRKLADRSNQFRDKMCLPANPLPEAIDILSSPTVFILPPTPQHRGILTILRSKDTSRQDFIFFLDRLATLLIENALSFLPYEQAVVETPVGVPSQGHKCAAKQICEVTIQRSGGAFERGFHRVMNDVPMGSLLVQSDAHTGEPILLQVKLPLFVRDRKLASDTWVFLLDSQVGSGAAAFMAIRVLLDHGVRQDHIIFVTFLIARHGGIGLVRRVFPEVRVVTAAVDEGMREGWLSESETVSHEKSPIPKQGALASQPTTGQTKESPGRKCWVIEPGMGQIGDRYYL